MELEVIKDKSKELGLAVGEAELEEFCASKRRYWGLTRAEEMHDYCHRNGITLEQWRQATEAEFLRSRVRAQVVSEKTIAEFFQAHAGAWQSVSLSRIVAKTQGAAKDRVGAARTKPDAVLDAQLFYDWPVHQQPRRFTAGATQVH